MANLGHYIAEVLLDEKRYQNVDDAFESIVAAQKHKIQKAAEIFNVPIPDVEYAFVAGNIVVLSDDVWQKLENSKSFSFNGKVGEIEDGIPMVLNYDKDKYYLVHGDRLFETRRKLP